MIKRLVSLSIFIILLFYNAISQKVDTIDHSIDVKNGSFDKLKIGESTIEDIIKIFGKTLIKDFNPASGAEGAGVHEKTAKYDSLGLYFIAEKKLGKYKVYAIQISKECHAKTKEGIVVGRSTLDELLTVYGQPASKSDGEYYYYYNDVRTVFNVSDNKIIMITIYGPAKAKKKSQY